MAAEEELVAILGTLTAKISTTLDKVCTFLAANASTRIRTCAKAVLLCMAAVVSAMAVRCTFETASIQYFAHRHITCILTSIIFP